MQDNGSILAPGKNCDGSDSIESYFDNNIRFFTQLEISKTNFGCLLNSDSDQLFGFENGFDYPILISVDSDLTNEITYLTAKYYNEMGNVSSVSIEYNGTLSYESNELLFYIGAGTKNDDFYRLKDISFSFCSNEWEMSNNICENSDFDNVDWIGSSDIIKASSSDTTEIHGWYMFNETSTVEYSHISYFSQISMQFRLFVGGIINNTVNESEQDIYNTFSVLLTYYDSEEEREKQSIVSTNIAQTVNCFYFTQQVRSYWEYFASMDSGYTSEESSICYLDFSVDIFNISGYSNELTIVMNYPNNINNNDTLYWGFNSFCLNLTSNSETLNPTPSPTEDTSCMPCHAFHAKHQMYRVLCKICVFLFVVCLFVVQMKHVPVWTFPSNQESIRELHPTVTILQQYQLVIQYHHPNTIRF